MFWDLKILDQNSLPKYFNNKIIDVCLLSHSSDVSFAIGGFVNKKSFIFDKYAKVALNDFRSCTYFSERFLGFPAFYLMK